MSNRGELARARGRLAHAQTTLEQVMALPRRVGARIRWNNGVIWRRIGDDAWLAEALPYDSPYESAHVGSMPWVRL